MFSLFELVWKRIRLFFTDDEVFYIGGADVLPPPLEREQENRCLIALSGLHGDSEPMTREDKKAADRTQSASGGISGAEI